MVFVLSDPNGLYQRTPGDSAFLTRVTNLANGH